MFPTFWQYYYYSTELHNYCTLIYSNASMKCLLFSPLIKTLFNNYCQTRTGIVISGTKIKGNYVNLPHT